MLKIGDFSKLSPPAAHLRTIPLHGYRLSNGLP